MMSKKSLLLIAQVGFYIALIWFVFQRFNKLTASVDVSRLTERPGLVILSIGFFIVFYGLLAWHWKRLCDLYVKFPQHHQWLSFFASQPYKYLPSSIFTFSSRAMYAKRLGIPVKQSSVTQLIENLNVLFAGACVALLFISYHISIAVGGAASIIMLMGLIAVCFIPSFQLPKTAVKISGRKWVALFVLPLLEWLFAGIAFYFMVAAAGQPIEFVSAVAANAVAVSLGIVAVFAPGGIGVREFVYSKFGVANMGIIMWRLMTLIIDVVVGLTAIYWIKQLSKKTVPSA